MKIFVTKEYLQECSVKIKELQQALEYIREDKNTAFEGDTNTWHDNFAYENATREEKLAEDRLFKAMKDIENYTVFSAVVPDKPKVVGMYCLVKIIEENIANAKTQEKIIGLVPLGAQDLKNKIYSYNAPVVAPLMGAKVGEERIIKIPVGTFKTKVLDIQKMR